MDDMHAVIIPKSDQLNADDLISGPRTIKITKVTVAASGEQRVSIFFEGDDGKPYKPGKSMCRVLVRAWSEDSQAYVGKSMTLYRDENVKWGGVKVGGIRISAMSDVEGFTIALTETRKSRVPFTVATLQASRAARQEAPRAETAAPREDEPWSVVEVYRKLSDAHSDGNGKAWMAEMRYVGRACPTAGDLMTIRSHPSINGVIAGAKPEAKKAIETLLQDAAQRLGEPTSDFPGDLP